MAVKRQLRPCVIRGDSPSIRQVGLQYSSAYFFTFPLIYSQYLANVYFSEFNNYRVRKVTVSTGIISTIAGTGSTTYSGDNGPATSAALAGPSGVATDLSGTTAHSLCNSFLSLIWSHSALVR
jgi:hypothetical protein